MGEVDRYDVESMVRDHGYAMRREIDRAISEAVERLGRDINEQLRVVHDRLTELDQRGSV